jgi:15-cis-phytoene synthase
MSLIHPQAWELRLLLIAQEALQSQALHHSVQADKTVLDAAYQHCDAITYEHSRTFYMASSLLPYEKRRGARALYAFCRITDDIVDEPNSSLSERQERLDVWRLEIMQEHPKHHELVALAWADIQHKFYVPRDYASQLIAGCERDIAQTRYETFADLAEYSYGVASTVGLMAMHIVGFSGEEALPFALKLGVALQVTNILRDVAEDWRNGRVYLPQDELAAFGLSEADIERGIVTENWRKFMAFQIERTRQLYAESIPGIAMLKPDGRFAIAAAAELYRAILSEIEKRDYDVFSRRIHLSAFGKVRRLPIIWWHSHQISYAERS